MSRIFITGSADGLGSMAAQLLIDQGHRVVLHTRNKSRAEDAIKKVQGAETVVVGDLSIIAEIKSVADQVNKLGTFDAVIHNAGIGDRERSRNTTIDGLPQVFAVNSLAPYLLTCLINKPKRLVYLSSGLHRSGDGSLKDLLWTDRKWNGFNAYSDSKLHDAILAFAVARKWPDVYSNAVNPGWVATKMGGASAPDNLVEGYKTQVWLATGADPKALISGKYFFHQKIHEHHPAVGDITKQEKFLKECEEISGVSFPM